MTTTLKTFRSLARAQGCCTSLRVQSRWTLALEGLEADLLIRFIHTSYNIICTYVCVCVYIYISLYNITPLQPQSPKASSRPCPNLRPETPLARSSSRNVEIREHAADHNDCPKFEMASSTAVIVIVEKCSVRYKIGHTLSPNPTSPRRSSYWCPGCDNVGLGLLYNFVQNLTAQAEEH